MTVKQLCNRFAGFWLVLGLGFPALTVSGKTGFIEVATQAGVYFEHRSGRIGELWTVEITGAGVGILDFDNDGLYDIWLVQGGPLKDRTDTLPSDQLFRNISTSDNLRFENYTEQAGLDATGYGMGIATGDIDNDGDTDVFLANFGTNQLLLNEDGRFRDITDDSGITGDEWSISASFADFDGDGLLDLYVANYLDFPDLDEYKQCRRLSSRRTYCAPRNFPTVADRLYRNVGNGQFADMTNKTGIDEVRRAGMGVITDDFDGNQIVDVYVANDMGENFLWLNRGDWVFEEGALLAGAAINSHGRQEASMGVAVADFDRDFDPDIFLTHDVKESNTLYVNIEPSWFEDVSARTGVAAPSLAFTGFGTGWLDVENDGDLDLFVANGSVSMIETQITEKIDPPLRQFNQLFLNDGNGHFESVDGGPAFELEEVSRGAAFGDLDNDGDVDIVVSNNDGSARIYLNESTSDAGIQRNWLGLQVDDPVRGRGIGALVWLDDRKPERKRVRTDGSYASANDPRLLFGLGSAKTPKRVTVEWPDGRQQTFGPLDVNRYHNIEFRRDDE